MSSSLVSACVFCAGLLFSTGDSPWPGFSAEMFPESIARFTYPDGEFWAADLAGTGTEGAEVAA